MKKILIANRGEIAIRVMKTAKKMGIKTVAVYSDADKNAPHTKFADEAVYIGESPSNKSYLLGNKIIEVAKKLNADAIHPGYGFLSENADFAKEVENNNLIFIGPKSSSIAIMGNKLAAKDAVKNYNIPMVPGEDSAIKSPEKATEIAKKIGFPILIKAAAGGGGKGMRVVYKESEILEQLKRAISEATSAFGDGSVFIEKYIESPRHIEIQILADSFGNTVHLFERECSVQRRHQKVIEEAPSSILTPELRKRMGEDASKVAKSCNYLGAGTVEFLVDKNLNYYFLEMNTRLQVEHPVTEFITGIDLVEEQINIAQGKAISFHQNDLKIKGHAIELRVYAEDSFQNFMPSMGTLTTYKLPVGNNVRVDNGFEEGMEIPIYYDPMLSKLITYGKTRNEAIQTMLTAIKNYQINGIKTTLPFGKFVFEHKAFISGNFNTHFVKNYFTEDIIQKIIEEESTIASIVAIKLFLKEQKTLKIAKIN
ncbi:acetyl-CoA carboxylase biotin carboxylase subunit [Lutibacter sp.]|uniref:acetyl-CoA carboxylase biotin carboxylase subunit n=1 Tax=Lutibacter sp. TaxID=1925666 RepID=UPI0025C50837|nr:acetyl-CoA carboxylase biotin carboxylase subunit [Lutibacter sp.]MCF6181766.1 acetyl-CoA carboxylase biotin carboxylase subunit [Lutibacter sp.]